MSTILACLAAYVVLSYVVMFFLLSAGGANHGGGTSAGIVWLLFPFSPVTLPITLFYMIWD